MAGGGGGADQYYGKASGGTIGPSVSSYLHGGSVGTNEEDGDGEDGEDSDDDCYYPLYNLHGTRRDGGVHESITPVASKPQRPQPELPQHIQPQSSCPPRS